MKKKLENSIGKKISIYHEDRIIKTGTVYEVGMCGDFIGIKLKNRIFKNSFNFIV